MTAGDIGTVITVSTGGFVIQNTAVATLIVQKAGLSMYATYPMVVNKGGISASYTTNGTEFPTGGNYYLALQVVYNGDRFTSPAVIQHVNNAIPI